MPHIYWSNAVPDAIAVVDVAFSSPAVIDPVAMHFTDGVGYHDKNWGDSPFALSVSSWYWGHARLGNYSLVWFDTLSETATEYFSGYVALDGEVLLSSCDEGVVTVRPWGANSTYPPTVSSGMMEGVEVVFELEGGERLVANVTRGTTVMDYLDSVYIRALGSVTGGLEGGEELVGRGVFEQFALGA